MYDWIRHQELYGSDCVMKEKNRRLKKAPVLFFHDGELIKGTLLFCSDFHYISDRRCTDIAEFILGKNVKGTGTLRANFHGHRPDALTVSFLLRSGYQAHLHTVFIVNLHLVCGCVGDNG